MIFTLNQIAGNANEITQDWNENVAKIKTNAKTLYQIISVRKQLIQEFTNIQEAMQAIMIKHGGKDDGNGFLRVPPEKIDIVQKELDEIGNQTVELDVDTIYLSEDDEIPAFLLELLFDNIEFK